jgi:hypothetical protein
MWCIRAPSFEFRAMEFNEQCELALTIKRFGYLFDMPEAVVVRQEELLEDPEGLPAHLRASADTLPFRPGRICADNPVHPLDIRDSMKGVDVK